MLTARARLCSLLLVLVLAVPSAHAGAVSASYLTPGRGCSGNETVTAGAGSQDGRDVEWNETTTTGGCDRGTMLVNVSAQDAYVGDSSLTLERRARNDTATSTNHTSETEGSQTTSGTQSTSKTSSADGLEAQVATFAARAAVAQGCEHDRAQAGSSEQEAPSGDTAWTSQDTAQGDCGVTASAHAAALADAGEQHVSVGRETGCKEDRDSATTTNGTSSQRYQACRDGLAVRGPLDLLAFAGTTTYVQERCTPRVGGSSCSGIYVGHARVDLFVPPGFGYSQAVPVPVALLSLLP